MVIGKEIGLVNGGQYSFPLEGANVSSPTCSTEGPRCTRRACPLDLYSFAHGS